MKRNRLFSTLKMFAKNQSGETAVQTTLLFSGAVLVLVLIGVPMLNTASQEYAYNKNFGIDNIQTSSVGEEDNQPKRYTIRKSVLDADE